MPVIVYDTREHPEAIARILKYLTGHGYETVRRKLDVGDWVLEGFEKTVIDRKRTLNELATNLCSADKGRFYREVRRAHEAGIHLIILCEHGKGIQCMEDVKGWINERGKVTGKQLYGAMLKCHMAYGVEFLFCARRETGKRIAEILEGNANGGQESKEENVQDSIQHGVSVAAGQL